MEKGFKNKTNLNLASLSPHLNCDLHLGLEGWRVWEMGVPALRGSPGGLEMGGERLNCHITERPMGVHDSMHPSTLQMILHTKE